jgi:hypothetical protein
MKVVTEADVRPRVSSLSVAISQIVRSSAQAKSPRRYTPSRGAAVASGALLASTLAVMPFDPVAAQDQQEDQAPLEEVVVTGSRIVRQDFTANSPIQTVDAAMFEQTSAVGVETVLNRLPQFVPAVTQFTTGDVHQHRRRIDR